MNNQKLSEFIGVVLGDGNIHLKHNRITITGSIEDLYYYQSHVLPIIDELFNITPKLKRRNDRNSYYIYFYSKTVTDYLIKVVGLVRGNKEKASIPLLIVNNTKLYCHFLRGLFDTDGCIKFSRQGKQTNNYPRVQIALKNSPLAINVNNLLLELNFNFSKWHDTRVGNIIYYQISGKKNLERWMKIIKPKNPVHYTKYLYWKRFGYYIPKSTLNFRIEALNLNTTSLH